MSTDEAVEVSPYLPDEAVGLAPGRGRLRGRRIVVVGAGTRPSDEPDPPIGNGRAIALLAAREGAAVLCVDKDLEAARTTAALADDPQVTAITADVTEEAGCRRIADAAVAEMGGLDGIVLNVGSFRGKRLAETSLDDWDATFNLNVRSHFLMTRTIMDVLEPGASLVYISSLAGRRAGSQIPAYDASKAAVAGLCRHVAKEGCRRQIRANVVAPGLIDTPLGRFTGAGRASRGKVRVPIGRQGTGWEIAYAAIFLLSDEASYITGQTLIVDGGLDVL